MKWTENGLEITAEELVVCITTDCDIPGIRKDGKDVGWKKWGGLVPDDYFEENKSKNK